jgi:hypothetical protein
MLGAIAAARGQADYYRISLEILRYATPLDVTALAESKAIGSGVFKDWLTKFRDMVMHHNPQMTMYRQGRVASGVTLYSSGGDRREKVLLVGLCGRARNLCCATAMFLQYFPDTAYDLVVLTDATKIGFTGGILGYAQPFVAAIEKLRADLEIEGYRETRTLGVSSGGSPALLAAALLKSTRAVCIGGKLPTDSDEYGKTPAAIELEAALRKTELDRAVAVFASGNSVDVANAQKLAKVVRVTLMAIPDMDDHALIEPLDRRGELTGFFHSVGLLG